MKAVKQAEVGLGVLFIFGDYPFVSTKINAEVFELANKKRLKLFVEFPDKIRVIKMPWKPQRPNEQLK